MGNLLEAEERERESIKVNKETVGNEWIHLNRFDQFRMWKSVAPVRSFHPPAITCYKNYNWFDTNI